ncbi:MAG: hypothetical protein L0219_19000, partial [Phycisphaerales bacterium]|nr:hypothetical protein [Phycisphaerales bacterium]
TFRGTATLFIRGDESSSTRICELCGRRLYHPHGRRHLVVRPPSEHSIFESQFHQLIVTPEIYDRVKQRQWRKLGVDRLKVLDQPRDGLPIF